MSANGIIWVRLNPNNRDVADTLERRRIQRAIVEKVARQGDLTRPLPLVHYQLVVSGPNAGRLRDWLVKETGQHNNRRITIDVIVDMDDLAAFQWLAANRPDVAEVVLVAEDDELSSLACALDQVDRPYAEKLQYAVIKALTDRGYDHVLNPRMPSARKGWFAHLAGVLCGLRMSRFTFWRA
jgi:hypothetical protein